MPHIHEKIDFTVEVFVVHKDKVLLRKHDKYKIWLSVGGHIELGEDPNQAAMREVKEEVGLDITLMDSRSFTREDAEFKELIAPQALNRHRISPMHEHVSLIYFALSQDEKVIPEKSDDEWKWLSKDQLQNLDLRPDIMFYASRALELLGD